MSLLKTMLYMFIPSLIDFLSLFFLNLCNCYHNCNIFIFKSFLLSFTISISILISTPHDLFSCAFFIAQDSKHTTLLALLLFYDFFFLSLKIFAYQKIIKLVLIPLHIFSSISLLFCIISLK